MKQNLVELGFMEESELQAEEKRIKKEETIKKYVETKQTIKEKKK